MSAAKHRAYIKLLLVIFKYVYVFEVSRFFVEVETVAEDEFRRDFEATVVDFYIDFCGVRFLQECRKPNFCRIPFFQFIDELAGGESCVDDIFYNDDGPSFDVGVESEQLLYVSCGFRSTVRLEPDKCYFSREFDLAEQVSGEYECAVEHADEQRVFAFAVVFNLVGYFFYSCLNSVVCYIWDKHLIVDCYLLHKAIKYSANLQIFVSMAI